jgi:FAD dependent oxidoreductase
VWRGLVGPPRRWLGGESEIVLGKLGIPHQRLTPRQTAELFPSFDGDDLLFSLHEPDAGVIYAREAVDVLVAQARALGASFVNANARHQAQSSQRTPNIPPYGSPSVWLVGGGPGTFKHAPALAEHVADLLTGAALPQAISRCPVRAPRLPV